MPEDLGVGRYSDELTGLSSPAMKILKTVRSVNADIVTHVFLSLEIFIVYKNPRATVIKPKTGIGGKIDMLSNIPKLKSLLGLWENKL